MRRFLLRIQYAMHPKFTGFYSYEMDSGWSAVCVVATLAGIAGVWAFFQAAPFWTLLGPAIWFIVAFAHYKWHPVLTDSAKELAISLNHSLSDLWSLERDVSAWGDKSLARDLRNLRHLHHKTARRVFFATFRPSYSRLSRPVEEEMRELQIAWRKASKMISTLEEVRSERDAILSEVGSASKRATLVKELNVVASRADELQTYLEAARHSRREVDEFARRALEDLRVQAETQLPQLKKTDSPARSLLAKKRK